MMEWGTKRKPWLYSVCRIKQYVQETEDENTTKTQQSFYLCKSDQHWTINQFLPITITACL